MRQARRLPGTRSAGAIAAAGLKRKARSPFHAPRSTRPVPRAPGRWHVHSPVAAWSSATSQRPTRAPVPLPRRGMARPHFSIPELCAGFCHTTSSTKTRWVPKGDGLGGLVSYLGHIGTRCGVGCRRVPDRPGLSAIWAPSAPVVATHCDDPLRCWVPKGHR